MVCIKECFLKIPQAPNIIQLDLVSPRCHSIAQVGRLLRPADFGNVVVLCECIQVSVKVLHSLLVGFGCFLQDPFHLLKRGEKCR